MILELLKNKYPQYQINDSSNRNLIEILKIINICVNCSNIIVYLKKNNVNKDYFNLIENLEKSQGVIDPNPIATIIINKDNYVYVRNNENNLIKILRCIDKNLLGNDSCCICMESKSKNIYFKTCNECQTPICKVCITKINELNCPCCKNDLNILRFATK